MLRCSKIAHFEVKIRKTERFGALFLSRDVQTLYASVAKCPFWNKNAKNLRFSDRFMNLKCLKISRRCDEKHSLNPKCKKTIDGLGTLLEVPMSKKIARHCGEKWVSKSK